MMLDFDECADCLHYRGEHDPASGPCRCEVVSAHRSVPCFCGGFVLKCMDCPTAYRDFPLDCTLPDEQWAMIHDSEGGVLCAACMVRRIRKRVPGAVAVRMTIDISPASHTPAAKE